MFYVRFLFLVELDGSLLRQRIRPLHEEGYIPRKNSEFPR